MLKIKLVALKLAKVCLKICYVPFKLLHVKNKVTFISRQSNTPNVDFQLLEEEINNRYPNCDVIMLTKLLENPILYMFHIFVQMYHIATSKVVVIDSYCIPISLLKHRRDLQVIQIWHSVGCMKQFGYAMIGQSEGHSKEIASIMNMHKNYTYVLISSYEFIDDFINGFRVPKSKILEIPLPRVDLLSDSEIRQKKRNEIICRCPELGKRKNILYCPTFRKEPSDVDDFRIQELIDCIDFSKYNLIYKPHNLSNVRIYDERVINVCAENYDIIFAADYMISDYSSVIYEAGLMDIPVYLYAYDWNEYKTKRSFNLNLENDIPTLFTDNPKQIIDAIENGSFDLLKFRSFIRNNIKLSEIPSTRRIVNLMDL